ncbi:hypothetical protein ACXPWS_05300 [Mycobacterium sp. BMJ-28]
MARLTHHTYCAQHRLVREVWLTDRPALTRLLPNEQWDLHDFFAPTYDFSDDELREYRQKITALDPSLPQRAGRALRRLEQAVLVQIAEAKLREAQPRPEPGKTKRQSKNQILTVRSLAHKQPDMQRMAKALLGMAREMAEADRAKKASSPHDEDSAAAA